jgi:DNA adenine methylase
LSKTANFTSYSKDSFSEDDQIRLANFCRKIHEKDAKFLLSNSDPQNENPADHFFQDHFGSFGFQIEKVKAYRAINCKASGRGQINELLITNY